MRHMVSLDAYDAGLRLRLWLPGGSRGACCGRMLSLADMLGFMFTEECLTRVNSTCL